MIKSRVSIFKGRMKGVRKKHLHRYPAEFDFRYNERIINDMERTAAMLDGAMGKRLTYRSPNA